MAVRRQHAARHLLCLLALLLAGCDDTPPAQAPVFDGDAAARRWNTPQQHWSRDQLEVLVLGEQVYARTCAGCHGAGGAGQSVIGAPALQGSAMVKGPPAQHVQIVLRGRGVMPAFGQTLSDAELAAVVSYERNAWGNRGGLVGAADVAALRQARRPGGPVVARP